MADKTGIPTRPLVKVYIGYGWPKFDVDDQRRLEGHEVLKGYFWSLYSLYNTEKGIVRKFVDERGLEAA